MNDRIKAIYPCLNDFKVVDIFGYSSKGIPGIEIIGLGSIGKTIKEKFVYLSRMQKVKLHCKRYVLCVELGDNKKELLKEDLHWLELPLLILLWSLSGHLPIHKLEDCFSSGRVSVNGNIIHMDLNHKTIATLNRAVSGDNSIFKYIAPSSAQSPKNMHLLPLEQLFTGKNYFNFS
ncbi:MAG: hypothetical protein ISR65_14035 [Bacteriovoracaceae bacterium]|nr:hypothetical protein [Bacteriovoracaceae bacterium]